MGVQHTVAFEYAAPVREELIGGLDVCAVADAIEAVFKAQRRSSILSFALPTTSQMPSVDPTFRKFASALLNLTPGLPIYVFGGASDFSRELLFALLPNLQAAEDSNSRVCVRYDALEAQVILHQQFEAMMSRGDIEETEVLREMTYLSRRVGMDMSSWS